MKASPLARKVAEQHGVDLAAIKTASGAIEKADVLAYVERHEGAGGERIGHARRASPPLRRRRAGWPPSAASTCMWFAARARAARCSPPDRPGARHGGAGPQATPAPQRVAAAAGVSNVWRIMAERMTASWTSAPHFYLVREVNVEPAGHVARAREQADRRAHHLHGSAGEAGGGRRSRSTRA